MKVQFFFRGSKYIAGSKSEAVKFLAFWNCYSEIKRLKTNWKFIRIERGPGWALHQIDLSKIEYTPIKKIHP